MADGGEAGFCSTARMHDPSCQYYADGGEADFFPQTAPPEPVDPHEAKYGTPEQMLKTGAEGFGQVVAGPLATAAEVNLLGVNPKDIKARRETNPGSHLIGSGLGIAASALLPESQLGLLGEAGAGAAKALGLQGVKAAATKMGVESALYTLGDEVSKKIEGDPNTIQSAAMHVGLSGLLGAGAGSVFGVAGKLASSIMPKDEAFISDFVNGLKGRAADTVEAAPEMGFDPFTKQPYVRPSTPALGEETLAESAGARAARKLSDYLSNEAADSLSAGAGGALGHALPGIGGLAGAIFGRYALKPLVKTILPSIVKPLLSSEASAVGMESAFSAVNAIIKGESALNQAARGLFDEGAKSSLDYLLPDHEKVHKLGEQLDALNSNPGALMGVGAQLGHYMPGHQTALAATAQNAVNYVASQHPQPVKPGPLNAMVEPSAAQMAAYARTLQIAEQPLSTLSFLKKGTLTPKDVQDLSTLYPGAKANIVDKINHHMIEQMSKGKSVPFRMRRGISMLMGQPMDISLTPASMMAVQATYAPQTPPQAPRAPKTAKGTAKLGKSVELAQTPAEARIKALQKA